MNKPYKKKLNSKPNYYYILENYSKSSKNFLIFFLILLLYIFISIISIKDLDLLFINTHQLKLPIVNLKINIYSFSYFIFIFLTIFYIYFLIKFYEHIEFLLVIVNKKIKDIYFPFILNSIILNKNKIKYIYTIVFAVIINLPIILGFIILHKFLKLQNETLFITQISLFLFMVLTLVIFILKLPKKLLILKIWLSILILIQIFIIPFKYNIFKYKSFDDLSKDFYIQLPSNINITNQKNIIDNEISNYIQKNDFLQNNYDFIPKIDLEKRNLKNIKFNFNYLSNVNFNNSKINFATIKNSIITYSNFNNTNLYNIKFLNSKIYNSKFNDTNLSKLYFDNGLIVNSKFIFNDKNTKENNSSIIILDNRKELKSIFFTNIVIKNSKISNIIIKNSIFVDVKFENINFKEVSFENCQFIGCKFDKKYYNETKEQQQNVFINTFYKSSFVKCTFGNIKYENIENVNINLLIDFLIKYPVLQGKLYQYFFKKDYKNCKDFLNYYHLYIKLKSKLKDCNRCSIMKLLLATSTSLAHSKWALCLPPR